MCIGFLYPETSKRSLEDMEVLFNTEYRYGDSLEDVRDEAEVAGLDEADAGPRTTKATSS